MLTTGRLRILETTDLHMHLLGYDYFAGIYENALGIAPLADVIATRRTDACLLCDNGDFLQGTPLADQLADGLSQGQMHPLAQAFNILGYDAVTLGNHDFDYGLKALARFADQLDAPLLSANVTTTQEKPIWRSFEVITRMIACTDGHSRALRIGVTGFAPPSLTRADGITVHPIVAAAKDSIAAMKAAGVDLIIGLCHGGTGGNPADAASALTAVDGIDVILMGHTHKVFPDPDGLSTRIIDHQAATIGGKPAVMAGYYGTSLGEIDLALTFDHAGWHIAGHKARLHKPPRAVTPRSPARAKIEVIATPLHRTHLIRMRELLGRTGQPLHNHFAMVAPDPVARLLASVMCEATTKALGRPCAIAAVAPFHPVGASGKPRRMSLPAGVLSRYDAASLYPFNDRLCALHRTGRQLRGWLAKSAAHYGRIIPSAAPQLLLNTGCAGYLCDGLYGLQYQIDLSQPSDPDNLKRITDIRFDGRPVADDDVFTIATTTFRLHGGGGFPAIPATDLLWTSERSLRDILARAISAGAAENIPRDDVWTFIGPTGATVQLDADVGDAAHIPSGWHPAPDGTGYLRHF